MDRAIGGYFGLELRQGAHYHKNAIKLNTARNCLEYIIKARRYTKIYIPYFICEVMLEPIIKCKINYEFYHIDKYLEPIKKYDLLESEAFLYTNYFGLKNNAVERLSVVYHNQLIIDNSQSFYSMPIAGIDTFYSARKFFGVPDGAYLYTNKFLEQDLEQDVSYGRMSHLLKRLDVSAEFGYSDFVGNEKLLVDQPIKQMSNLTEKILMSVDYDTVKAQRIENYNFFEANLKDYNKFKFALQEGGVPMIYPFFTEKRGFKEKLIKEKIYVATYWPNIKEWCQVEDWEYKLSERTVFLPVDQRCSIEDMEYIVKILIE